MILHLVVRVYYIRGETRYKQFYSTVLFSMYMYHTYKFIFLDWITYVDNELMHKGIEYDETLKQYLPELREKVI